MKELLKIGAVLGLLWVLTGGPLYGQDYGARLGLRRGGSVSFEPRGPGVLFGALDPAVKKWYVPQELFNEYHWRQWEYSNYARQAYARYVSTTLEGDHFYDFYGNFIGRGWLVYDWRQSQPQQLGNSIFQNARFNSWFSSVTIGGDSQGQYHYAITVGNQLRTTLTPLTFSKPTFNGIQIDFMSDKYAATVLAARVSDPIIGETREAEARTNVTSLFGGRATMQLGDFVEVGATLVDCRNANTTLDLFSGDMIAGGLTAGQSTTPLTAIVIVLSDDTPADGEGGAALFSHEVRIVSRNFETGADRTYTLQEVVRSGSEWPVIFGGFRRSGYLAADGNERIVLNYDFNDPAYIGPDPTSIIDVEFDYVLANDFRIDLWSDRQTGRRASPSPPLSAESIDASQPALITLRRADGNVKDISNLQRARFNYGLPTANMVGGFTLEGTQVAGFDFYGEWDRNRRYSQYPNAALFTAGKKHRISAEQGDAWHFNVSKQLHPWFLYGESYHIDPTYSTTAYLVDANGDVRYDDTQRHLYEFVEDNDDQDRYPDWSRFGTVNDRLIFPGLDENSDFINDFNQNDNSTVNSSVPDYEEPFLRYQVDRPEFLFGIDMNNNNWIDRFEDDDLPDYPYKPDRRGYNAFGGVNVTPELRLTAGRTSEKMMSTERKNQVDYLMVTLDQDYAGLGRLRVYNLLKRAEDTIPDDRRELTAFIDGPPIQPVVADILPAQDTWVNTAWLGFDYTGVKNLNLVNKFKYEFYSQGQDDPRDREGRRLEDRTSFLGLINKVDYLKQFGRFQVQPKFKSEYLRQTPFLVQEDKRRHWMGVGQLVAQLPALKHTLFQAGVELLWFRDLMRDEEKLVAKGAAGETGDRRATSLAVQLSNTSDYQGYRLTTQVGLRFSRLRTELVREGLQPGKFEKISEGSNETTSFITVYAGVE